MTSPESVYRPTLKASTILFVDDLRVWFPLRRSLWDILLRRSIRYAKAVDGVSFDIDEGGVLALVGESGCGKTTTGRAIARLVNITSGVIGFKPSKETLKRVLSIERSNIVLETGVHIDLAKVGDRRSLKILRREIQIVFQDPYAYLNPRWRILEAIEEPLKIHGIGGSREERIELVAKTLETVKLTPVEEVMYRYVRELSGGQRQRVLLARALILRPRLLIADEPLSMLDTSTKADILNLMVELKNLLNISYVFITHEITLARYIADEVAVMYLGKIVEIGSVDKVLSNPLHPYTQALIRAIPRIEHRRSLRPVDIGVKGDITSSIEIPSGCRFHPRCPIAEASPELKDLCVKREPSLSRIGERHYVSCWLYYRR